MNQPRQPSTQLARPSGPTTPAPHSGALQSVRDFREQTRDFVGGRLLPTLRQILPASMKAEQFQASLVNTIDANPRLFANRISLAIAVFNVARLGLDTNPILQHVFLIPREIRVPTTDDRGKKRWDRKDTVTVQIGYKGLIFLGRRAGLTTTCEARVVRDCDEFDYTEGLVPNLVHRPKLNAEGKVVCAYARAIVDGRPLFRVVDLSEIQRAMRASASAYPMVWSEAERRKVQSTELSPDSPWATDFEAMCQKTAIRRFYKSFDLADAMGLAQALQVDADYDSGRTPRPADNAGAVIPAPPVLGVAADWGGEGDEENIWGDDDSAGAGEGEDSTAAEPAT